MFKYVSNCGIFNTRDRKLLLSFIVIHLHVQNGHPDNYSPSTFHIRNNEDVSRDQLVSYLVEQSFLFRTKQSKKVKVFLKL